MRLHYVAVLALHASSAYACTCTAMTVAEAESQARFVFRGTITGFGPAGISPDRPGERTVYFSVSRVWKGLVGVNFGMPGTEETPDCIGFAPSLLKVGNELLVYARMTPEGAVYTTSCMRTALARDASDFKELGPGYDPDIREPQVLVEPAHPQGRQALQPLNVNPNLPDGRNLFSKYLDVTKDYSPASTLMLIAELSVKNLPLHGSMTGYQDISGRSYMEIDLPPVGKFETGFDGNVAWSRNPTSGPSIIPKKEARLSIFGLSPQDVKNWNTRFEVDTIGEDVVDGKRCYLVRMTPRAVGTPATACLDTVSGLMVKLTLTVHGQSGDESSTQIMRDYRDEDGVLLPHEIEVTASGLPMVFKLTDIRRNIELPANAFELPKDVQTLIDAQKDSLPK